ncbi:MAG: DegT/DnrJ/EryC1/StrS family aminotransferase [Peptostreptococcaceae bacterium]|nr:DegT/DnrJ/EryC1/StrS family aminotransferase [Peptostreptococcaceae bacterium]
MEVKFFDPTREYNNNKDKLDNAVSEVLKAGNFIMGNQVKEFEKSIADYTGAKYAIAVSSGSDALALATDVLEFNNNKEVITSPFTFFSSASCLYHSGAKPVFVDVDKDTFNMDMNLVEEKINKNTAGILPVHLFSQMTDMDKVNTLAGKYNLKVLEDAAEAFGMKWQGTNSDLKHSGTIGDMGIFSFFPTKTLGAYGDAGMIVTNNEELYDKAKSYRVHGATKKYHHDYIGYNARMDTIQAAILNIKLKNIDKAIEKRKIVAEWYYEQLIGIIQITLPSIKGNQLPVYYVFNIKAKKRDELQAFLKKNGIQTTIYYPRPLHLQKCFDYLGYKPGDFPVSENLCNEVLALPIYPEITENEVLYVCEKIKEFFRIQII